MPIIELPNGQRIDTEGLDASQVTSTLTALQKQQPSLFQDVSPSLDLTTASKEEILEYKRQRDRLNVDPVSGEQLDTTDSLKDPDVDYTSGLQDFRIRAGFANKEKDSEKAAYLTDQVGKDGFRQDKGKRFIITKEGRKKLGMPDGPEFAVDEEGVSRYDIADFVGEAGVPLTVGIGASIAASGVGFLPGVAIVGGATAVGKLLDEAFEASQGYQRQTAGEIAKDAAWEGVFGATGEGVGRGLSRLFGRLFKGSGSKTAEDAKEIGREMRRLGFAPTVEGGAPGAFGILTRLQAVYEGISPNKKAAERNVNALLQQLKGLRGFDEDAVEELGKVIQDDITKLYSSYDDAFAAANRELDTEIERRIAQIMEPLKRGDEVGQDAVEGITQAKNIFNKNVDFLYKKVDDALGKDNQIIPLGKVQEEIEKGLQQATKGVRSEFGKGSAVEDILKKVRARARRRLQANGVRVTEENIRRAMRATTQEATMLRNIMSELEFTGNKTFGVIKGALDESFMDAEDLLNVRISVAEKTLDDIDGLPGQMTNLFQGDFGGGSVSTKRLKEGLTLLRRTKQYYAKGYKRLNDPVYQSLVKATSEGRIQLDPVAILGRVVKNNQPKLLERILRSRRGVSLKFERLDETPTTVRFGEKDITLREAEEMLRRGDLSDPRSLQRRVNEAKAAKAREVDEAAMGGVQGENLRQALASAFLRDAIEKSSVKGVLDGKKLAGFIDELGTTKDVLFKSRLPRVQGELDDLNELTSVLRQNATQLDDSVIEQLSTRPLAEALKAAKEASLRVDALNKQTYLKSLRDKDASKIVDTIFTKNNPQMIKAFMNNTIEARVPGQTDRIRVTPFEANEHVALVNNVRDAAMGRILKSIGDVNSPMFADDFLSGRLGSKFKTSLEGYGRDSLNAMFGRTETDRLFKLSEVMIRASDKPLAGKGGLAAPSIALGLSIFGLMTAPLQTIGALAFYSGMSKLLRTGPVLDIMLASRKPGADQLGQVLQSVQTINAQVQTQAITSDEGPFKLSPEAQRSVASAIPNVAPAFGGTSAANVDPTNPIVNPDPATQALAQALNQRPPS